MTRRHAAAVLALAVLAAGAGTAAAEPSTADRGFRGCLAERGGRVLAAENADRLFVPASVVKLVVAAAALHHLGPEHRTVTEVRAGGPVVDGTPAGDSPTGGVLEGDLVVVAGGDPTWSARFFPERARAPLEELARQVRRRVRRVRGDLVVDVSRFPGPSHPPSRSVGDVALGFAAPTSGLAVDENTVGVDIAPGPRVGAPARARLAPGVDDGALRLVNHAVTVPRERDGDGTVAFQGVWHSTTLVLRGEYPLSEPPYRVEMAVPDGDLYAGRELARVLRSAGVALDGEVVVRGRAAVAAASRTAAERGAVLARLESPPISALLEPILADSRNWHAEMLLRLLAAHELGVGRGDDGVELLGRFLEDTVGVAEGAHWLEDASGVSPHDLLTPRAVVQVLDWARRQPWRRLFLEALATPGRGTLRGWPALPAGTAAKTGTLRHTLALAGYVGAGGEPVVFACMLNHRPDERGTQRRWLARTVRGWSRK